MRSRRFGAVRHLADLFDRYAVHRPAMIEAWAAGDDTDGLGRAACRPTWPGRRRSGGTSATASAFPARPSGSAAALRPPPRRPDLSDLPPRLSLFGLTRLPASHVEVLDALATARDVHLFLLHPSPALWTRIACPASRPFPRAARRRRRPPPCRATRSWRPGAATPARCNSSSAAPRRTRRSTTAARAARRQPAPDGSRPTSAPTSPPGPPLPGAGRPRCSSTRRRQPAGALLPRAGPPGRGAPRRDPPPPRRRPDARATRRDRDVPGHRDVRPADPRHVRRRRARRAGDIADAAGCPTSGSGSPTARCARPTRSSGPSPSCSTLADARVTASQLLDFAGREPVRRRSASTTTTSPGSRSGSPPPASAGGSTPPTGRPTSSTRSPRTPGGPASTGCSSA